jgi:hypothetical protein
VECCILLVLYLVVIISGVRPVPLQRQPALLPSDCAHGLAVDDTICSSSTECGQSVVRCRQPLLPLWAARRWQQHQLARSVIFDHCSFIRLLESTVSLDGFLFGLLRRGSCLQRVCILYILSSWLIAFECQIVRVLLSSPMPLVGSRHLSGRSIIFADLPFFQDTSDGTD